MPASRSGDGRPPRGAPAGSSVRSRLGDGRRADRAGCWGTRRWRRRARWWRRPGCRPARGRGGGGGAGRAGRARGGVSDGRGGEGGGGPGGGGGGGAPQEGRGRADRRARVGGQILPVPVH